MNQQFGVDLAELRGARLLELCLANLDIWRSESEQARVLDACGFDVAADMVRDFSQSAYERAAVFYSAYQFERLAGLA